LNGFERTVNTALSDTTWYPFNTYTVPLIVVGAYTSPVEFKAPALSEGWNQPGTGQSDMSLDEVQTLLGTTFTAKAGLTWLPSTFGEGRAPQMSTELVFSPNINSVLSTEIMPMLICGLLAYLALWLPAATPMAMPRVGITLLALVSLASLYQRTSVTAPAGINWMKAAALGLFVAVFIISVIHGWIFTLCVGPDSDADQAAALRQASKASGAIMLFCVFAVIPTLVCAVAPHMVLLLGLLILMCGSLVTYIWWRLKQANTKKEEEASATDRGLEAAPALLSDSSRHLPENSGMSAVGIEPTTQLQEMPK